MLKTIKSLAKNSLLRGSSIMIFGSLAGSFVNYLTNVLVGRHLGPAEYGIFASLISLLMIFSVFNTSLNTVVVKFVSAFKAKNELGKVEALWRRLTRLFAFFGLVFLVLIVVVSPVIANFLKIPSIVPVVLLGIISAAAFLSTISLAVLNGLQKFFRFTAYSFLGALGKLVCSLGLVFLGFKAAGALGGFVIAQIIPFLLAAFFVVKLSNKNERFAVSLKEPLKYSLPVMLTTLGLTMLYTLDTVLAKRFLSPVDAGLYSGLSVIGRVILFGTSPVALVMFPLVAERLAENRPFRRILWFSLGLTVLGGFSMTALYFIFPKSVLDLFFGREFYAAIPYLGWFGLLLTLYSLCNLLTQFLLSKENKKVWILTCSAALFQAIGIFLYHGSIMQILQISFIAMGGLLVLLIGTVVVRRNVSQV